MGLINSKKNERDEVKYSTPNGIYPTCSWDLKTVKKLILEKKLAPFYPGSEEKSSTDADECPICFLFYIGGLNNSRCCKKGMCTECFLQIKKPNTPLSESTCPFCNRTKFTVVFTGPKTQEERQKEEEEEQRVIQLQHKIREEEIERDKEREKQRQLQKGKEKAKPAEDTDKDRKADEHKHDDEPGRTNEGAKSKGTPKAKTKKKKTARNESEQRARYKSLPGTSDAAVPADSGATALGPSSYPPPLAQAGGASPEKDLEELMLMEAIRLSLMESGDQSSKQSPRGNDGNSAVTSNDDGNSKAEAGPSSPFSDLFGVEADDFEARVKGGIVLRTGHPGERKADDKKKKKDKKKEGDASTSSESESEEEKGKEKEDAGGVNEGGGGGSAITPASRRGRTSSTTVPIEETPLGSTQPEGN